MSTPTYRKTKCYTCGDTISVPTYDYAIRNYCYTCAMSKLGEIPNANSEEAI